jgi:hypothetical protein
VFTRAPTRVVRTDEELAAAELMHVADLLNAFARHPDDEELCSLIDELRQVSPPTIAGARRLLAQQAARDHEPLDVGGALFDLLELGVAHPFLDRILA